jgi:methanogenic corrinoid protein MtbC1
VKIKRKKIKVKTIIGGWPTSPEFARKIGADAWGEDAIDGLKKLDILMKN